MFIGFSFTTSEQQIFLSGLSTLFEKPLIKDSDINLDMQELHTSFGITAEDHVYLFPHTIMKYSPGISSYIHSYHNLILIFRLYRYYCYYSCER